METSWAARGRVVEMLLKACKDPKVVKALSKKGTVTICQNAAQYGSNIKAMYAKWKGIAKKVGAYKRKD